jgi:hypothetical protein
MSVVDTESYLQRKRDAHLFLKKLEDRLNFTLPAPAELRAKVRETAKKTRSERQLSPAHLRGPEASFLNHFVIPEVFELVSAYEAMDDSRARQALLSEYEAMRKKFCSGAPTRQERHPFRKIIGTKPTAIMQQWLSGRSNALTRSAPDLAIRDPFPFKLVFECKYFEGGGVGKGATDLVTSIYQSFFYLGLPYIPSRNGGPSWDYEFACMLAGDASEGESLRKAWEAIPREVRRGFWEGANIFVMIVRGAKKQ